ncbi:cystine/glutamate transporter-like [Lytechinus pictus]|uniref:cystine/glutamate transporter-like n=1 Tax=Lytechinus pictus TaxID=7653 RepID=UPI0030B9E888
MISNENEFKRRTSLSSSLRRLQKRHGTTSTGGLELIEHDYSQQETDVECRPSPDGNARDNANHYLESDQAKTEDKSFVIERTFGSMHCTSILLGVLVSFGSLFSVREIFMNCGGLIPALFVWISAGAMMFVGAQCYAELATCIPKSGGDFVYLYHALPTPMPAFMQVWMGLVMGSGATISALGKMGGVQFLKLVCRRCDDIDRSSPLVIIVAALIICLLIMMHCRSSLLSAWFQVSLTCIKLGSFAFIIALGFVHIVTGRTSNLKENMWYPLPTNQASPMVAFAVSSMSFTGWQSLTFVTEEVKKPEKNIPYVTSFSVLIAIGLCMALNISYATLLTPQELLSSQPIIMLIGDKVLGSWSKLVHLPILICTLSDINIIILIVSRMFFSAGRERQSPSLWAMLNVRYNTPSPAILVMLPIALILLVLDISSVLSILGPFQWLTSAMVVATLLIYRIRYPDRDRPFKVPWAFPFIYILYCIFLTSLAIYNNPRVLGLVLAIIAPAFPLQIILIRLRRPRTFLRAVGNVTRFLQKLLLVAKPDDSGQDINL